MIIELDDGIRIIVRVRADGDWQVTDEEVPTYSYTISAQGWSDWLKELYEEHRTDRGRR